MQQAEYIPTIVVGGGQAGLAVGHHLGRSQLPFEIFDASQRVGDAWRSRWDSLCLFSPAAFDGLVGCRTRPAATRSSPRTRWRTTSKPTPAALGCLSALA